MSAVERLHYRFGDFEFDPAAYTLLKNGERIKLQNQPFRILRLLLAEPGRVVSRDEFRSKLWPADTFVDFEHSLNTAIKKLREAMRDSSQPADYIETVPKVGYRFAAAVEIVSAPAPKTVAKTDDGPDWEFWISMARLNDVFAERRKKKRGAA